jgi:hypothetical protein
MPSLEKSSAGLDHIGEERGRHHRSPDPATTAPNQACTPPDLVILPLDPASVAPSLLSRAALHRIRLFLLERETEGERGREEVAGKGGWKTEAWPAARHLLGHFTVGERAPLERETEGADGEEWDR